MYCRRVSEVEIEISETVKKVSIIYSFFREYYSKFHQIQFPCKSYRPHLFGRKDVWYTKE